VASFALLARLDEELRGAREKYEPTDGTGDAGSEGDWKVTGWST